MSETENPRAARIRQTEPQRCPRRDEGGVASRFPEPDWWERGRWAATQEEADAEVADFMSKPGAGGIGNVLWCYPGDQPRTCSFCGGVHPEDAIGLIRAGWEVGGTDKGYKRYLEPPGHRSHHEAVMQHLRSRNEGAMPKGRYPSPVPPVKLYVQHFSEAQIAAFNAALDDRRAGGAPAGGDDGTA